MSGIERALRRYQVMAWTVGVGLLVLVLVGVPLQVAGHPKVVQVVGPLHGFLYIIYLFAAFDMARRARFSLGRMVLMLAAGLVPFVAFVIERKVSAQVEAAAAGAPVERGRSSSGSAPGVPPPPVR